MRSNVVTLAAATIVTGASAAYAANETITMNAIDANGVGKEGDWHACFVRHPNRLTDHATAGRSTAGRPWIPCPRQSELWSGRWTEWSASGRHGGWWPL